MDRKAQAEELFPAFWYLLTIGAVTAVMVLVIYTVLGSAVETYDRDNAIFDERIYAKISTKDALTGRVVPGVLTSQQQFTNAAINHSFDTSGSPRRLAFKLTYDAKSVFFDKALYAEAKPLSPVRYKGFVHQRPLIVEGELKSLEIDQVYNPRWEELT